MPKRSRLRNRIGNSVRASSAVSVGSGSNNALDMAPEAVEVFSVEGVRLLFHPECYDMWMALRERANRA